MPMTPYRYGIKNRYTPTHLIKKAYGWSGTGPGNLKDVPTHLMLKGEGMTAEEFRQQFAYEWLNSSEVNAGYTNPPFVSGAAGRLLPFLETRNGIPARIQRGYIRRGEVEAGQDISKARLYFMFNPETITRDYVSYLDQTALDPFNTVYQSSNLVAPPSILDFSFSLFFDRAEEAMDPEHPGVFVDYQFFDLVVRNVTPDDPNSTGNTLPDNGVMMVNPREITVVFSQQLSVQGRPLNARVSFLKFTHRMVPTRMQIDLTIRATYLGPLRPQTTYTAEEWTTADTIPLGEALTDYEFNYEKTQEVLDEGTEGATNDSAENIVNSSANVRLAALQYAIKHTGPDTKYGQAPLRDLPEKNGYFDYVDCSSLVVRSYRGANAGPALGLGTSGGSASTAGIIALANADPTLWGRKDFSKTETWNDLQVGDLLIRPPKWNGKKDGHVAFVYQVENPTTDRQGHETGQKRIYLFAAHSTSMGVGPTTNAKGHDSKEYQYVLRPNPTGWTAQVGNVPTDFQGPH